MVLEEMFGEEGATARAGDRRYIRTPVVACDMVPTPRALGFTTGRVAPDWRNAHGVRTSGRGVGLLGQREVANRHAGQPRQQIFTLFSLTAQSSILTQSPGAARSWFEDMFTAPCLKRRCTQ